MTKPLFAFFLAATLVPFAAVPTMAQTPPDGYGPPPAIRAQLQQIRATYKTNAFNALTQAHRDQVNAVIAQVDAGSLERRDAATQIDTILSPSEAQAVLAQGLSMRDALRKLREQNEPAGEAPPPNAPPNGEQRTHRAPDAGRILVMLASTRRFHRPSGQQP